MADRPMVVDPPVGAGQEGLLRDRLDFTLPDFTRLSWVDDRAREVWAPRLQAITAAWHEIEWQAVIHGIRRCSVAMVGPEGFLEQGARWAGSGLNALPIELVGASGQPYSATAVAPAPGQPFVYRFVLGAPADVVRFKRAWDRGDQEEIGGLLGYPSCCREFFRRSWVELQMVDTTWPMAAATAQPTGDGSSVVVAPGPLQANILWRWMGVRAVPHLPCRFDCAATVELGTKLIDLGRRLGYPDEMRDLEEILSWPVEWSALHGIAEIKTPLLKVSTRTDATGTKHVVRREGEAYPAEGARGLHFPYRVPTATPLTQSRSYQSGLRNILPLPMLDPGWNDAHDNGFSDRASMDAAHGPVVMLASTILRDERGDVLDLGCGNGALLEKIKRACPSVGTAGIELDAERVARARTLHPSVAADIVVGDMFEADSHWPDERHFEVALLMPGRLLEVSPERASRLRAWLRSHCERVLVYAYGDWITRYGDIGTLARAAGLQIATGGGGTVGVATWDADPRAVVATGCENHRTRLHQVESR